eukprot:CAMPEP_0177615650 /NCGR_PEP_ID=MMETSP0419_2-20121207/23585_1 /TAXON_ID=582737 /ORGANISM="Tetraselmis sp., Strain GSL018" /LENGTH=277 /DNA_ID=CAMNT_0019113355 /DNA_START=139 /DNA_END=970 /DNA_ORIENTATION=-
MFKTPVKIQLAFYFTVFGFSLAENSVCSIETREGTCKSQLYNTNDPGSLLPQQFSARVNVTSHRVPLEQAYPPARQRLHVWFDSVKGRSRTDFLDKQQSIVRRFDTGYEVKVARADKSPRCWESALGGRMAGPSWPAEATFEGRAVLRGVACDRWREDRGSVVADIFTDAGSGAPVEVQVFSREGGGTTGSDLTPDITFSVWDYAEGPPAQKHFDVSTLMQGGRGACQGSQTTSASRTRTSGTTTTARDPLGGSAAPPMCPPPAPCPGPGGGVRSSL